MPVIQRTAFTAGDGILIDTSLFGRIAVREPLTVRLGFSGDDLAGRLDQPLILDGTAEQIGEPNE